jgi:ABC-2 type transport system ATP-binding protein
MQVRLAFSCAIRVKSDILILDEVLAVGDEAFQRKCNDYFDRMAKDKSQTIVLVTHSMDSVKKYCNKALLISDGNIKILGSPDEVAKQYTMDNLAQQNDNINKGEQPNKRVKDLKIKLISKPVLNDKNDLIFNITYHALTNQPMYVGFSIIDQNISLVEHTTILKPTSTKGRHTFRYKYPLKELRDSDLKISAAAFDEKSRELIGFTKDNESVWFVIRDSKKGGILQNRGHWIEYNGKEIKGID